MPPLMESNQETDSDIFYSNRWNSMSKHLSKFTCHELVGPACETELPMWRANNLEQSLLSEGCSELDDDSEFGSKLGERNDKDSSHTSERNWPFCPATINEKYGADNLLLLNPGVVHSASDWNVLAEEAGGNDLPNADLVEGVQNACIHYVESKSTMLETMEVQEDMSYSSDFKLKDVKSQLPEITDTLGTENALRTSVNKGRVCITSGSGRPDLEEDDVPTLSSVIYDIETVNGFHSYAKDVTHLNDGTKNYIREDIGIPSWLSNCLQNFHLGDKQETNSHWQKPRIETLDFESQGFDGDVFPLHPSHVKIQHGIYEKELDCLVESEEQEVKAKNPLTFDESSARHDFSRRSLWLGPLPDANTIDFPTAEKSIIYNTPTIPKSEVSNALYGEKQDPRPDELSQSVKALDMNESYVDTVHDMEDVLLDSGESTRAEFVNAIRGLPLQSNRPYQDGGLSTSTSDGCDIYKQMKYSQKIDSIEVIGTKQRRGEASFGERLVGVKEYTVYQIRVQSGGNQWETEQRYRDFIGLYHQLKRMFSATNDVRLPPPWENIERESRKLFGNTSHNLVEERSTLIQECLLSLIQAGAPFDTAPPLFCFLLPCKGVSGTSPALEDQAPVNMLKGSEEKGSSFQSQAFNFLHALLLTSHTGSVTNENKEGNMERVSAFGRTIRLIVQIHPYKPLKQLLEAQHYLCAGCFKHLDEAKGLIQGFVQNFGWGKPHVCEYMGQLFCASCHSNDTAVLPGRVLQMWDFTPRPVSQLAKAYLDSIYDQPMLCVSAVNPYIFSKVPVLMHVMEMRRKLSKMFGYIHCPYQSSIQQSLGSRRYLLESSDFFALRDLVDLSKGAFSGAGYAVEFLMILGEHIRASIYPTVSAPTYNMTYPTFDRGQCSLLILMEAVSKNIHIHITEQCSICRESGRNLCC